MPADRQPLAQHRRYAAGERLSGRGRHRLVRDDDELVAAEPRDHALRSRAHPKSLGEHPDEPVARGMAQVVVDRFQPVEVEVQSRDRSRASRRQPVEKMRDQRPAVVQAGQIVVFSQIAKLFFGGDAGLQLSKQGGDRLERVDLFLLPLPGPELDEPEHTGGRLPRDQRSGRHRGRRGLLVAAHPALEVPSAALLRPDHHRLPAVFAHRKYRVGAGEMDDGLRIGVRRVRSRWPLRNQHRSPDVVVMVTQEAGVHVELLDELCEYLLADLSRRGSGGLHQLGSNGGDDQVQAAWQRSSDMCACPIWAT